MSERKISWIDALFGSLWPHPFILERVLAQQEKQREEAERLREGQRQLREYYRRYHYDAAGRSVLQDLIEEADNYMHNRATEEYKKVSQLPTDAVGVSPDLQGRLLTTRELVIDRLGGTLKSVTEAYNIAVKSQPLAADIPVFHRMLQMQKDLGEMMQQVQKLRGL